MLDRCVLNEGTESFSGLAEEQLRPTHGADSVKTCGSTMAWVVCKVVSSPVIASVH